jgi:hypothetical protein
MVVAVLVVGAEVPVARVVPLEVVLVLLHGELPQLQVVQRQLDGGDSLPLVGRVQLRKLQMVQRQLDGGDMLPLDGRVQLRKLILVGISSYYT